MDNDQIRDSASKCELASSDFFSLTLTIYYESYFTRCKDVTQKEDIGATQAVRLNTTVKQLKKLFLSRKTKTDWLGKKWSKGDAITETGEQCGLLSSVSYERTNNDLTATPLHAIEFFLAPAL